MSLVGKYNWLMTGLGLTFLKKGLGYRTRMADVNSVMKQIDEPQIVNRLDYLLNYCHGKKVLHVGFGDYPYLEERLKNGSLLHTHLRKIASDLWGYDNNEETIRRYTEMTGDKQVISGDLMKMPLMDPIHDVNVVLLGEVLEHLRDPHLAVENLYNSFPPGTDFLVTVPNYTSLDSFAGSLYKKELVHPDHYWYFSPYTLLRMFSQERFSKDQLLFGMYFEKGKNLNPILRQFPYFGDCIIAVFKSLAK
jgi:hypothetical protein